jgi:hypothetical protein
MGDHIIDLIHAEQDDEEGIEDPEPGAETGDRLAEKKVCTDPDDGRKNEDAIKKWFALAQQTPDMELQKDQCPFYQGIDIERDGVALVKILDQDKADDLGHETDQ